MSAYSDKVIADGAVAYWRLNEASGTSVASAVAGPAAGTISGGVTLNQPGAQADGDKAMTFDGTGMVTVPNGAYFAAGLGPLSMECWFKTTQVQSFKRMVDGKGSGTTRAGLALVVLSAPVALDVSIGNGSAVTDVNTTFAYADGRWRHFVAVITRGSPDTVSLYIDGALAKTQNVPTTGLTLTSTDTCVIGSATGLQNPFIGSVDEVAVYLAALTPQQIADHYAAASMPAAGTAPYAPLVLPSAKPPHGQWLPLTPSDIVDSPFSALWVGGAGTVAAVGLDGRVVPFVGVQAGTRLRIAGRRVNDTATTATALLALGRT